MWLNYEFLEKKTLVLVSNICTRQAQAPSTDKYLILGVRRRRVHQGVQVQLNTNLNYTAHVAINNVSELLIW